MSNLKEYLPQAVLVTATLTIATFGFWGGPFLGAQAKDLDNLNIELPSDDPVPPVRNTVEEKKSFALDREWGPSPFLSAAEEKQYGRNLVHITSASKKAETPKKTTGRRVSKKPVPVILAMVRSNDGMTVLLDDGLLRIDRETNDVRIIDRNGDRVLVECDGNREWMKIIPRESLNVNGAGR